jgi:hypothetical protein
MRRVKTRLASSLGGALIVGLLAFPAVVTANTGEPIAQTGGMSVTLPIAGTSLTVDVTLDKTTGNISTVALSPDPLPAPGPLTQTSATNELVKYANADGTTTVTVRAKGSSETVRATSGSLDTFVGDGHWSADVFGTGDTATVNYHISKDGSGNPGLTVDDPTGLVSGATFTKFGPKTGSGDEGAYAVGGMTFSYQGYTKKLTIAVFVSNEDGSKATVKITLTGRDRQKVSGTLPDLAGVRTWSAHLCDGTPVSVTYEVTPDGKIQFDSSNPTTSTQKAFTSHSEDNKFGTQSNDNGLRVTFDGTRVGVTIRLHRNGDGSYTLIVKGTSGKCGSSHDANGFGKDHAGSKVGDHTESKTGDKSGSWGFGGFGSFGSGDKGGD